MKDIVMYSKKSAFSLNADLNRGKVYISFASRNADEKTFDWEKRVTMALDFMEVAELSNWGKYAAFDPDTFIERKDWIDFYHVSKEKDTATLKASLASKDDRIWFIFAVKRDDEKILVPLQRRGILAVSDWLKLAFQAYYMSSSSFERNDNAGTAEESSADGKKSSKKKSDPEFDELEEAIGDIG